jgi:hypothetical protein
MATWKLLLVVNYAVGGVQQSTHGDTCARIAFHTANRTKIRHSIRVNACLWAMVYSFVVTTETRVQYKAQCFPADDAPKKYPNGSECNHDF